MDLLIRLVVLSVRILLPFFAWFERVLTATEVAVVFAAQGQLVLGVLTHLVGVLDAVRNGHSIQIHCRVLFHFLFLLILLRMVAPMHQLVRRDIFLDDRDAFHGELPERSALDALDGEDDVLVDLAVHGELAGLAESARAASEVTLEGLLLGVDVGVLLQVLRQGERLKAEHADVLLNR